MLQVDVRLQRLEIGLHVRVAVVVAVLAVLGEEPLVEGGRRALADARRDLHRLLVVRGIEVPAHRADRVLHEIDHRCAVLLNHARARRPDDHLRAADHFLLREEHARRGAQLRVERERDHARNDVRLLGEERRLHIGKRGLDGVHFLAIVKAVLAQHRAHDDVHGAAGDVGRDHLALQVPHRLHGGILEHEKLVGVVALDPILELVGDHPQVVHARVLHRNRERGKGEVGDLELVVGERGDHLRRALEVHRLEGVGLALVPRQPRLFEDERGPVRYRHHVRDADLQRLLGKRGAGDQ